MTNNLDFFADLEIAKLPEDICISVYRSDIDLLKKFHEFKQKEKGGEIVFAELFSRVIQSVFMDKAFAKGAKEASGRNRSRRKTDTKSTYVVQTKHE